MVKYGLNYGPCMVCCFALISTCWSVATDRCLNAWSIVVVLFFFYVAGRLKLNCPTGINKVVWILNLIWQGSCFHNYFIYIKVTKPQSQSYTPLENFLTPEPKQHHVRVWEALCQKAQDDQNVKHHHSWRELLLWLTVQTAVFAAEEPAALKMACGTSGRERTEHAGGFPWHLWGCVPWFHLPRLDCSIETFWGIWGWTLDANNLHCGTVTSGFSIITICLFRVHWKHISCSQQHNHHFPHPY